MKKKKFRKGIKVKILIKRFSLLEKRVAQIFHKNNNDEALEQDLRAYADILAETFQTNMLRIMAFIQPVFFVVLACFIIFIYVTLMRSEEHTSELQSRGHLVCRL